MTGTRRCPLKSLFGFCDFLILVICTLHLFVLFVFIFASCVCYLLFYMSICVAMVNAHKVEQGTRVCPRLMVVFNPNSVCLGSSILSSRIIRVSNFIGPRMCYW